jgi:hypothetical protein
MSHQDQDPVRQRMNSQLLRQVLQGLLAGIDWSSVTFRLDCVWSPRWLCQAAILWAWSDETTLMERFKVARRLIGHLSAADGVIARSYQSFLKLLCRWTVTLVGLVQVAFQTRMRETLPDHWRVGGYVVFAVDGSRVELCRTKSNEAVYSPPPKNHKSKANAKKASMPLMWLTMMIHVGTGLPWDWRTGPSNSSERAHALEMLNGLPADALLTGDAGFVGYEFARTVLESRRHLLVRVGANVRLLKKLGYVRESAGTVYVWTDRAAKRREPPLVFRLVVAQGPRHPIYLLTNNPNSDKLSDGQVFEIYKKRWGIELFYRHLKQTFQRRKLRSASAENVWVELEWSLVALWGLGLTMVLELSRNEIPLGKISVAGVLRVIRRLIRDYLHPVHNKCTIGRLLRGAVTDPYIRTNKQSRDYPRKKKHELIGIPIIEDATASQIQLARTLSNAG